MGGVRPLGIGWYLVLETRRAIGSAAGPCLGCGLVLALVGAQSCPALCSFLKGLWGTLQGRGGRADATLRVGLRQVPGTTCDIPFNLPVPSSGDNVNE